MLSSGAAAAEGLREDKYDQIRAERHKNMGTAEIVTEHLYIAHLRMLGGLSILEVEAMKESNLRKIKKEHVRCVYANEPEMIVCAPKEDTRRHRTRHSKESSLASALYFRRCDGTYRNLKWEKLAVGEDTTRKKRKRPDEE